MRFRVFSALLGLWAFLSTPAWGKPLSGIRTPSPALIGLSPELTTWASNSGRLSPKKFAKNDLEFTLRDGTRMAGLFFPSLGTRTSGSRPLIIASLGIFTDRFGEVASGIYKHLVRGGIDAHFLLLDSSLSGSFYARNGEPGIGSYDEGRILHEIAGRAPDLPAKVSSIHLLGISFGGQAVLHALIQDQVMGSALFSSAIIFSAVLNLRDITALVVETFSNGRNLGRLGRSLGFFGREVLTRGARRIRTSESPQGLRPQEMTDFFKAGFKVRMDRHRASIGTRSSTDWIPDVSMTNFDQYIASADMLLNRLNELTLPLLVVHAKDDPIIPFQHFAEFADRHASSERILTLSTRFGGHWGFSATYGGGWLRELVNRMLADGSS